MKGEGSFGTNLVITLGIWTMLLDVLCLFVGLPFWAFCIVFFVGWFFQAIGRAARYDAGYEVGYRDGFGDGKGWTDTKGKKKQP